MSFCLRLGILFRTNLKVKWFYKGFRNYFHHFCAIIFIISFLFLFLQQNLILICTERFDHGIAHP